jgi:hypothetical protein
MHVDTICSHQKAADGTVREYRSHLLRHSFRDEQGRPRKETLANLTALPDAAREAVREVLRGEAVVSADDAFAVERSVSHGDAAAACVMAGQPGLRDLPGPACRERDVACALIVSRAVRPESKLSTVTWRGAGDTTIGPDPGVADACADEVYAAMDWLESRQRQIEKRLAARHLREGGIAMSGLSSSWVEGRCCELAASGHSRDGKRGRQQIEYGLLTDPQGRPVAVEVFAGNTAGPVSFKTAVTRVRVDFGITSMIMAGDRGMITGTRIDDLRKLEGTDWITSLRAPAVAALAGDGGPLQMSLSDVHDFAEISHPGCPGERLICCCNPFLAAERASRRQALLTATEADLDKIAASAAAGRLKDPDKIGIRVGKVIGKHKMARHFITQITGTSLAYRRDAEQIAAEAAIDGIYVIRTSVTAATLDAAGTITACKNLKYAGRDLAVIKTGDPGLRPIYHYLDKRVRAHVLIAMLAAYLTWHLRAALAELTFTDQHIPEPASPVAPARRSPRAKAKDAARRSEARLPVRKHGDLLSHLSALDRQTVTFSGQHITKLTEPTPVQRRVFELPGAPIPITLK